MQGEIVDQLREVVKAREAAIAQLSNEQKQAALMFEAVRLERDRLQHEVTISNTAVKRLFSLLTCHHTSIERHGMACLQLLSDSLCCVIRITYHTHHC